MNVLKFYRTNDWIKNIGITLIGVLLVNGLNLSNYIVPTFTSFLLLAHIFSFNDLYDFKEMKEMNYIGKNISSKKITFKKTLIISIIPAFIAVYLSFLLGLVPFMISLISIILFVIYSHSLLRLKSKWWASIAINSIVLGPFLFLIGYSSLADKISFKGLMFLIIFFSYIAISEIIHQISHRKIDKKYRIDSLPNVLGIKKSIFIATVISVLPIITSFFAILTKFSDNSIFLITIFFNFIRFLKLKNLSIKSNFPYIRNNLYGKEEGIFYSLFLLIAKIL